METRAHYIVVGLFTLLAAAAVLLFALWMSGAGDDREVNYYEVIFREPVSGLTVGSPVQYSGIRVGEVNALSLDPQDPRIVRAGIQVLSSVPMRVDTVAQRTLLNITGASAIELSEGSPESPRLRSTEGVPVIEATPSAFSQLQVTSEELLLSALSLLERANQLFSDENSERVSRVLDNIDAVTNSLVDQGAILREGLEGLAQSSRALNQLLDRVNEQMVRYDEPVLERVAATLEQLQGVSEQLNAMLAQNSPALASGMQGFAELGPAMQELRAILDNVNTLTRRVSEDPTGFVLGNDNIREYQP